jgi:hypothetical protein
LSHSSVAIAYAPSVFSIAVAPAVAAVAAAIAFRGAEAAAALTAAVVDLISCEFISFCSHATADLAVGAAGEVAYAWLSSLDGVAAV